MKFPIAILLSVVLTAGAVETRPVEVLAVLNGLTIRVKADVGGQPCPVTVRLSYMSLTDPISTDDLAAKAEDMPSTRKLRELLPNGSLVTLQCAQPQFQIDDAGRVQAVVCVDENNPASDPANQKRRRCIQEEMIKSGWARFDPQENPDFYSLFQILQASEEEARAAKRGIWDMGKTDQP